MKKYLILLVTTIMITMLVACNNTNVVDETNSKITVAVSIVPEASFVKEVAGDLVDVVTVIPKGNSPANYQPTTIEMQALSDADIYFVMHVPTEEANILPKVRDFNKDIILVDLREVVSEDYPLRHMDEHVHDEDNVHEEEHDENHEDEDEHEDNKHFESVDPHIWLSPSRVIVMVQTIADELSKLDSENESIYQANAEEYIRKLEDLDSYIKENVNKMDKKTFMIYHGSYGYFAQDYGLEMISLEVDGKAATAVWMQQVIDQAKEQGITAVFYQDEFDDSQAQIIAEEINGAVKKAVPLGEDYIKGLKDFANALSDNGE